MSELRFSNQVFLPKIQQKEISIVHAIRFGYLSINAENIPTFDYPK